jgi:hypothetical protein
MFPRKKTDPRLPLCKTLPGNRLQTATQGSLARGCDVSGLYLRTRPRAHTCTTWRVVESRNRSPGISGAASLENSFPVFWAKDCSDKLTCSVWLGGETENRLCVPRGAPRSTRSSNTACRSADLSGSFVTHLPLHFNSTSLEHTRSTTWVFSQS